jgi:transcriptional regulator with XRE-family HTH domain
MISGRQIRAARGLLNWSVEDLARKTGLTRLTISKIEDDAVTPHDKSMAGIISIFDKHGVEFLDDDGVRVRKHELRVFSGKTGYRQLLDHIYETMKFGGGRIRQLASDAAYLRYADDYAHKHVERMADIPNLDAQVLTLEGDDYFPASYCTYRWLDKSFKSVVPFYVYNDYVLMSLNETANKMELLSVHSKLLAERYVEQFEMYWSKATTPKKKKGK